MGFKVSPQLRETVNRTFLPQCQHSDVLSVLTRLPLVGQRLRSVRGGPGVSEEK